MSQINYFGEKGKGHILKIQISSNKSGEFVHCELRYVARTQLLLCLWRHEFRMELRGSGSQLIQWHLDSKNKIKKKLFYLYQL